MKKLFVNFVSDANEFSLYQIDKLGRKGKVSTADKNGMEVPKKLLNIAKNEFIYKWFMMKDVIEKVSSFEPSDCDYWDKALKAIECMKLYGFDDMRNF